ncbi:MAG: methyltransferase/methylase [Spirosoma sp.]|nr:methyltransferase/methylase [Spirosoma sp.]
MNTIELLDTAPATTLSPARIMDVGMSFWASKTLLTAVKLDVFTELSTNSLTGAELQSRLGLHPRSSHDFFDTLVSLGFLERVGNGAQALYGNAPEAAQFLNRHAPTYIGGLLEMANDRMYPFWGSLEEGLRTGLPQNEMKKTGKSLFDAIYEQPAVLEQFLRGMSGGQMGNFMALAHTFDFGRYDTLCDIGGANATLSICVARQHPHLHCLSVDLPAVVPVAARTIAQAGLSEQIQVGTLDFMRQSFPQAQVITMGNILHDWSLDIKQMLIGKAYQALPDNGALVVIENIIDDERRQNSFGLLMSLNMLIETDGGFDYTHADFHQWATQAGFRSTTKLPLAGPCSAVVAYK